MASRDIKDCTPTLRAKIKSFTIAMFSAGIPFIITCTARTVKEQIALWRQGRASLAVVNEARAVAGLSPITAEQNKCQVTWTLSSKHIVNPEKNKSRAFDFAIASGGKPVWDLKVNVNGDNLPDYEQAGKIGEACGLCWGGRFKKPDYCHFEEA